MARYDYINVFLVGIEKNNKFNRKIYAWPSVNCCFKQKLMLR